MRLERRSESQSNSGVPLRSADLEIFRMVQRLNVRRNEMKGEDNVERDFLKPKC